MSDKLLFKYYLRLRSEGFLKAFLWSIAIGFGALAIFGVTHWMLDWKIAWLGWVIFAVISACSTFALYYWKYRPTTKYIARRIDDLGLHERILTMTELEGDDSYIARKQREDALKALGSIRSELLTIGVSVPSLVTSGVALILGVFGFLFSLNVFGKYAEVNPVIPTAYKITYSVMEGEGSIQGQAEQSVAEGETTEMVVAVPADGWRFLKWDDGKNVPYREDEVEGNKSYYAVFVEVDLGTIPGLPDDVPADAPGNGEEQNNNGSQDNEDNNTPPQEKYEESNLIVDGETYYGDLYDEAYKDALEKLGDDKYTDDQKEIANGYFDNIEKGNNEDNN